MFFRFFWSVFTFSVCFSRQLSWLDTLQTLLRWKLKSQFSYFVFSRNLSHAFTPFPSLWFSFLKFSPHFPAAVITPNSVLWFLGPERLWIFYSVFSSNAQSWLQPTLRLRAIKGGNMPFLSSKCWLPSLPNSFSSFSSTFSFFLHFFSEFIVAVFGKAGSSSSFLSHIKCGLD